MNEPTLHKARWPWPGRCAVCGAWGWLKAWDEGLQGRVCTGCLEHVAAAEAVLADQGFVCLARATATRQERANGSAWRPWMELGALWALWDSGAARPSEERKERLLSPEQRARHEFLLYALLIRHF